MAILHLKKCFMCKKYVKLYLNNIYDIILYKNKKCYHMKCIDNFIK